MMDIRDQNGDGKMHRTSVGKPYLQIKFDITIIEHHYLALTAQNIDIFISTL